MMYDDDIDITDILDQLPNTVLTNYEDDNTYEELWDD